MRAKRAPVDPSVSPVGGCGWARGARPLTVLAVEVTKS